MSSGHLRPVTDPDESGGEPELLTIEQLAARTGMTVRNIRSHRARNLLPPPEVHDRVGYYGPDHVARLELIRELQAEGFNLAGIKRLLEQTQPEQLLGLKHAVGAPFASEQSQVFTAAELEERFGALDHELLARAERLGLLIPLGDDRYEATAPSLIDVAAEVVARGVPLGHALAVIAKVAEACQAVSREFVRLFMDDVWAPFARDGYPESRWSETIETVERLRPISSQAVLAVYQATMTHEVEKAFGRELERISKRG
jgi:DNA-binding transcriptional MerR regulator